MINLHLTETIADHSTFIAHKTSELTSWSEFTACKEAYC